MGSQNIMYYNTNKWGYLQWLFIYFLGKFIHANWSRIHQHFIEWIALYTVQPTVSKQSKNNKTRMWVTAASPSAVDTEGDFRHLWLLQQHTNGTKLLMRCHFLLVFHSHLVHSLHNFWHFQLSEEHANGTDQLARYDFLLAFYSDLRSSWNRCWVISH